MIWLLSVLDGTDTILIVLAGFFALVAFFALMTADTAVGALRSRAPAAWLFAVAVVLCLLAAAVPTRQDLKEAVHTRKLLEAGLP